ncbi:tetratricopeptide repeat-containing sulfotransferase family protein [Thalassotalea sp. PS06]|uniref:tetratricopeptide repeat-containing sulfotransferase family protein n=1 Tax=Thalassotalea sp. PS06 TaxID=2594005 RepID=UPI001162FBF3|nr:sulfotransferase [Thalassotalea sp. PS06]QDP00511.1 tetratricopeptide repeat protein [Thalassotalea sp. PS06]
MSFESDIRFSQVQHAIKQQNFSQAQALLDNILAQQPENIEALTQKLTLLKEHQKPIPNNLIELLLRVDAMNVIALEAKLSLLEQQMDYFQAVEVLKLLNKQQPENLLWSCKLALNALSSGQVTLAHEQFEYCLEHRTGQESGLLTFVMLNLGHVYKAQGHSDKAKQAYLTFIDEHPSEAGVGYWSIADLKDQSISLDEFSAMEALLASSTLNVGNKALIHFAQGKYYEQQKDYQKAFACWQQANEILAKYRPFKAQPYHALITSLMQALTPQVTARWQSPEPNELTPIFIVGMPRSGTTLVEQILTAHSDVQATDELPFMERLAIEVSQQGNYGQELVKLTEEKRAQLAKAYLKSANPYLHQQGGYFIDKNPNNFLHIGLIKAIFPNARIINLLRDPMDNAMSVFKQYFSRGHEHSYHLDATIFYWQGYLQLMTFWKRLFGDQLLNVGYEQLTDDSEAIIRQILDYCGLEFEPDCLEFYKSDRAVLTPSVSQVRRPINKNAVGAAARFQSQLTPWMPKFAQLRQVKEQLLNN